MSACPDIPKASEPVNKYCVKVSADFGERSVITFLISQLHAICLKLVNTCQKALFRPDASY